MQAAVLHHIKGSSATVLSLKVAPTGYGGTIGTGKWNIPEYNPSQQQLVAKDWLCQLQ